MKNIFIYGMSGSGKDTIANFLQSKYDFIKLRIAGTIKQYVYETYGFKSLKEFEEAKRLIPNIRIAHHTFGYQYKKEGELLSKEDASLNRLDLIINRELLEFEIDKNLDAKPICICDVRRMCEIEKLLAAGWLGIFLTRTTNEYKDVKHATDQSIFANGEFMNLLNSDKYNNQIILIANDDKPLIDQETKFKPNCFNFETDGSKELLLSTIDNIINNIHDAKSINS